MANKRITQLNEFTGNPSSNDVFVFVQNSSLSTYKITYSNLLSSNNINVNSVYTTVRDNSASWEESAEVLPTVTNYLSTNSVAFGLSGITFSNSSLIPNVLENLLVITGSISGFSSSVSFNAASASGTNNFAVNQGLAQGNNSAAFNNSTATGQASLAQGSGTIASGSSSHAEGNTTVASGTNSHAEGYVTKAEGLASHAEGYGSEAYGQASHAAGYYAGAIHDRSWAWAGSTGNDLISTTRTDQFMVSAQNGIFVPGNVGIGTDANNLPLTVKGEVLVNGSLSANSLNVNAFTYTVGNSAGTYLSITVAGSAFKIPLYFES